MLLKLRPAFREYDSQQVVGHLIGCDDVAFVGLRFGH
jgi:hypothetical protein